MTVGVRLLWRRDSDALAETAKAGPALGREALVEGAIEDAAESPRPPASLARIALPLTVLVVGLLAGAVWYVWASYRTIDQLRTVEMPLAALGNEIAYQAAAMRLAIEAAAATGDAAWEGRYWASAERLNRALARVREIAPGIFSTGPHAEPLAALRALRTRDRRLFTLLRAGRPEAASRAIADRDYRLARDGGGEPLALVAVGEDVTDACQVERERRARAKAERANRAKSRFLAAASHDLRQPLQAARLFVAALRNRANDAASAEIVDHIDETMASTENLLNALLDLSRLDAGALEPEIEDTPIGPLLRRLAAAFRPQAAAKGVALRVVDSSAWTRSDPVLLENILRNLIANAVRYTPKGRILIGCRRRGDALSIEVWDTGKGIAEEQHAAIFEEFRQLGAPERDHMRGLGLGLAIVDRLCRLLGHRVSLRSAPGRGSVFAVAVPRVAKTAPAARAEAGARTEAGAGFAGLPVLVVEDEPRQRASLALLLGDWGCRVETAADGGAALKAVEAGFRPGLAIADLYLPGEMDGVATIAALRRRLGRRLPALIVTGDTEPAALRPARRNRLPVLRKPVEARRLHAALSSAVAKSRIP